MLLFDRLTDRPAEAAEDRRLAGTIVPRQQERVTNAELEGQVVDQAVLGAAVAEFPRDSVPTRRAQG